MKFVALVSGGKDSCFNIIHCLKQGHELVALANLYPSTNIQELDSFMFQTVGFDIVEQYTKCINNIPLFRQPIEKNSSKNVDLNYIETEDDEIEELYTLLLKVKQDIPDLEAVSVGAILSSYQRTRVENVCQRLNLTALSYLWQRSQEVLMNEMCLMSKQDDELNKIQCAKLDARIIKVAAIGLDASHLGKTLPQILPVMTKLNRMYDVHICGEGGEFESMVIDAPFFNGGYLELEDVLRDTECNNNGDGVFSANLKVNFKERTLPNQYLQQQLEHLPTPSMFDNKWNDLLEEVRLCDQKKIPDESLFKEKETDITFPFSILESGSILYISNIHTSEIIGTTVEEQTQNIFTQLRNTLKKHEVCPSQILNSSLILSDMNNFSRVNMIYNQFFDTSRWGPLPPSRTCIGSKRLGRNILVQLSVIVDKSHGIEHVRRVKTNTSITINSDKNGLHVQGRSYWAPCNIGPYSQAIWSTNDINQVTYISGQIALNPSDMTLIDDADQEGQAVLSLKHFDTLKQTTNSSHQLSMICYITNCDMVGTVCNTWRLYCSDMDIKSDHWMDTEEDPIECLIIVRVSELPRGALCEWGGVSCKELKTTDDYDTDLDIGNFERRRGGDAALLEFATNIEGLTITESFCRNTVISQNTERYFATVFCDSDKELIIFLKNKRDRAHVTLYFNPDACKNFKNLHSSDCSSKITVCPVDQVFDCFGVAHQFGLHISTNIR
ncbi:similar to Saccharomyces cerevisiae YLR143W Putative protein of unknown function [Maudiozyma barnettii]|uniref:Diphthine--ammonia ligase n=1 Tax=Maudiozyma barnettii TaxID=61262 RepID=A0A8H2VFW2_9SACH|nr:diphthine--ammonia ligase [Kazachstania barnettii]CAB4254810.1 similar to Saccharomyces cerevisiae YLR143W Putative protein of unknown function [Kazachstania barnettii]CAD1782981.1 similar to Saccharomyces cerevisiae YLR143W Putative protein of unknown function [Kazachstania barnettii]